MSELSEAREIAKRKLYLWENHDKFRMVEGESEPDTVKLARAFLAMDARAACDGEDARDAARYR